MTLIVSFFLFLILAAISWLDIGLAVAVALVGVAITAGWVGGKLAAILEQVQEALAYLKEARSADSPGGKQLTEAERQELLKESIDVLEEIWKAYGGGIIAWIGKLFKRK